MVPQDVKRMMKIILPITYANEGLHILEVLVCCGSDVPPNSNCQERTLLGTTDDKTTEHSSEMPLCGHQSVRNMGDADEYNQPMWNSSIE
jgi:hypothetical protein